MSMQSELQENIAAAAFNADDAMTASEAVIYNPSGGTPRPIQAMVFRPEAEIHGNARAPDAIVTVLNNATTGISSTEINVGKDTITVAPRYGKTAEARRMRLVSHNAVIVKLEVQ